MKRLIISLALVLSWQLHADQVGANSKAQLEECNVRAATDICNAIDTFFALIAGSENDSNFGAVNQFLIPYKKNRCGMLQLLRSVRTFAGVQNTTPLHVAARGDNIAIAAIFFQKLSAVTTSDAEYDDISHSLANARDGNNQKPIDYTDDPTFINLLENFTDP